MRHDAYVVGQLWEGRREPGYDKGRWMPRWLRMPERGWQPAPTTWRRIRTKQPALAAETLGPPTRPERRVFPQDAQWRLDDFGPEDKATILGYHGKRRNYEMKVIQHNRTTERGHDFRLEEEVEGQHPLTCTKCRHRWHREFFRRAARQECSGTA